ncbi:aldose 1-epimerase family protein [Flavobacterium sp.]|uniref:aldose 1-epimerase family protein n=1 Tax=Flavobacterium sp. TaxID=239 RepID=UPI002600FABD|nr:aldose 1-epimerase family protein [Flavobacterium sp.]
MKTIISNSKVSVIIHHKGAELISLKNTDTQHEYIWEGNPRYWAKHSPILFPIVGTLKNNCYTYKNKIYSLARHGFARDMVFDLISSLSEMSNAEAIFSLRKNIETEKMYPFDFELQIKYALTNSQLLIVYKVINNGSNVMYYSIGGHPALALPKNFEKYSLQFQTQENLISHQLENDLLSNKTKDITLYNNQLPLSYSLFENDALIFKKIKSKQITILENNVPILNFKYDGFPNFGIWTKNNAPFICLEPWAGYSDLLNSRGTLADKEGIQKLDHNDFIEYRFSIEIL